MTEPAAGRRRAGWGSRRILLALPLLLLLLQVAWVRQSLVEADRLRPVRVADTDSYARLAKFETIEGALSHFRTYGYPLLLRSFGRDDLIPLELWLYLAGTVAFFFGIWGYSGKPWIGLAAASPLLYGDAMSLLGKVQPDFLACGLTLFSVAALLGLIVRPRNPFLWATLIVAFFASYQVRPATLFMAAWLPALGWALAALHDGTWRRPRKAWLAGLVLAVLGPYLCFAGWRASRIGEFGLVAFGGYNLSGMAACFVDEAMLEELEPRDAALAEVVLQRRQWRGFEPYRSGEGSVEWFKQYSRNIWRVSIQAAKRQVHKEGRPMRPDGEPVSLHVAVNKRLGQFSREVIRRRPGKYISWVKDANLYGWRQLGGSPWVKWPAALFFVTAVGWCALAARRPPPGGASGSWPGGRTAVAILIIGLSFFVAYVMAISLLSFPFGRYYAGTVLLLPSSLCGALAALVLAAGQRFMTASTSSLSTGGEAA